MKKLFKQKQKDKVHNIIKTNKEIFPIRYFNEDVGAYVLQDGSYFSFMEIASKDIQNSMEDEVQFDMLRFAKFLKLYSDDIKFVAMNFPINTQVQQLHIQKKIEMTNSQVKLTWLERTLQELALQVQLTKREYYLFYFSKTIEDHIKNTGQIENVLGLGKTGLINHLADEKKHRCIHKLNNMTTLVTFDMEEAKSNYRELNNYEIDKREKEAHMDVPLFEYLQPQGGITFKEPNYILSGTGYTKVLHVYQLPKGLNDFWLKNICNIDGTIATIDIATKDKGVAKKNINKALQEEASREKHASDFEDFYEARKRREHLQHMFEEIESMGEVVKMLHFRIFLSGRTLSDLEMQEEKIIGQLDSDMYMAAVLLNEGKSEWQSLYRPFSKQHQDFYSIKPQHLMTEQIAGGNPFHYSDLADEFGTLLGFTPCLGPVIYDEFHKSKERKHYNSLAIGDMSSGKSTLLKKRFRARAERGDFIRCFDVTGEFKTLTEEFGGKIIKCDGQNGILNPLEILISGEDDFTSFANHISKVSTFYKCFKANATDDDLVSLQNVLRIFYEELGLVPNSSRKITGLVSKDYPTLSTFHNFVEMRIEKLLERELKGLEVDLVKEELLNLQSLKNNLFSMVQNFGQIFDGITSIDNIVDQQIITFDISTIKDMGNIFVAQLFNMVSLCWDNCISNGSIMKEKFENGEIAFEDVTRFLIIIDESHRWVNTKIPMILERITIYLREARKFFGGIMLASQSLRDFMPEGTKSEHLDLIKSVFELTQYKFVFRQDSSVLPLIDATFDNALTISQRQIIPMLGMGECILSITGDKNIKLDVWLSKEYEDPIFKGGK